MQNKKRTVKGCSKINGAEKCGAGSQSPRGLISMNRTNEDNNIKNWLVHP